MLKAAKTMKAYRVKATGKVGQQGVVELVIVERAGVTSQVIRVDRRSRRQRLQLVAGVGEGERDEFDGHLCWLFWMVGDMSRISLSVHTYTSLETLGYQRYRMSNQ